MNNFTNKHTLKHLSLQLPRVISHLPQLTWFGLASLVLVGCGSGDGSSSKTKEPDYSNLSASELKPESLREASASELERLVKNGLRLNLYQGKAFDNSVRESTVFTNAAADSGNSAENVSAAFSTTNVQVQGVDEADFVKYDGKHIFLATPIDYTNQQPQQHIKIFAANAETAHATEVSKFALATDHWGDVSELYLVSNNDETSGLVTLRRSWNFIAFDKFVDDGDDAIEPNINQNSNPSKEIAADISLADEAFMPYHMQNGVEVTLYDVRSPSNPDKAWTITLDGNLLSSRKIGNTLYLVTSFMPWINQLEITSDASITNETLIQNTSLDKLLPEYSINGGSPQALTSGDGCLIPQSTDDKIGYSNFINITAINLSTQTIIESVCVNGYIDGIYSSQNHLYLGGSQTTDWNFWQSYTVVHQFALTDAGVDYRATGAVEGTLGWNNPAFRMDEHDDNLRLVTTTFNEQGERSHHLHILRNTNNSNELSQIAQLPNDLHPEPIGKPREDIYAVRFYGERAYVVTFERIDPLYVLDLSDATDPVIAGELEIPGFSTYLHPVGDNYLFSLGNETDSNSWQTGIKVSLFDIRDITNPVLVNSHVLGNSWSWSEALYNYRALSFLQTSDDQLRINFPMEFYENIDDGEFFISSAPQNSLQLFEINGLTNDNATLTHVGEVVEQNSDDVDDYWYSYGRNRGLMHDDALFFVQGAEVKGEHWPTDE